MPQVNIHRNIANLAHVPLFYLDTKTDGPAILCLHGRWGRAETWVDFMRHYGDRYRIIAPDQRGHGLSGKPVSTYSAEELAGDAHALLCHVGLDAAIVVGHSMGGRIAGCLAALYHGSVNALAVLDKSAAAPSKPAPPPPEQIPAVDPLTKAWPLPFPSLADAVSFLRRHTRSELEFRYMLSSLTETAEGFGMLFSTQAMAASIAYEVSWFHLLPDIRCPVLLIRSKGSGAVTDEELAKMKSMLPHCMAEDIEHPDHNVHLADKDAFYGIFDKFLKANTL